MIYEKIGVQYRFLRQPSNLSKLYLHWYIEIFIIAITPDWVDDLPACLARQCALSMSSYDVIRLMISTSLETLDFIQAECANAFRLITRFRRVYYLFEMTE